MIDEHLQEDPLDPDPDLGEDGLEDAVQVAPNSEDDGEDLDDGLDEDAEFDSELFDAAEDEEYMDLADPMIDKAARDGDDSDFDDAELEAEALEAEALEAEAEDAEPDDSELADDIEFDELDAFMDDDAGGPDELSELVALEGLVEGDDLEDELKAPLTASQQALAARRAIEERAEARRIDRDLNYLDFELDD